MKSPGHDRAVLPAIQLLRGWTSCLVVLAHANLIFGHKEEYGTVLLPVRLSGMFAVAVFFVISGFIIAVVSLDDRLAPRLTIANYAKKRFVRIVPFMWLSILGYNALSAAATRQVEWLPMLNALLLWPIGAIKPNIVWSLQHELLFYVLFALSFLLGRRHIWVIGVWIAAPVAWAALALAGMRLPPDGSASWLRDLATFLALGGFSGANLQFGAGLALGLLHVRHARRPFPFPIARVGWVALAGLVALAACLVEWTDYPAYSLARMLAWTALAAALVRLASAMPFPNKESTAFRFSMLLGDASFAIYLVHATTLMVLFAIARKIPSLAYAYPVLTLAAIFSVSLASGIVAHKLIERPLIRLLTRRDARAARPAPAL